MLCCWQGDDDDEAGQQQPPVHGGRLGWEDEAVLEDAVSSSGDRRPGTEAVWAGQPIWRMVRGGCHQHRPPPSSPARLVAHCKVHTNICHIGSNITKCSNATTRWPQNLQLIQINYAAHSNLIRFSYKILIFDTGRSSALSLPSNPDGKSRWVRPEQESVPDITAGCQLTISILMWAMW